jgi:putative phage-type endonuclease
MTTTATTSPDPVIPHVMSATGVPMLDGPVPEQGLDGLRWGPCWRHGASLRDTRAGSPGWVDARRAGITATDVVAILGLSPHRNAVDVWASKLDPSKVDPETSRAMRYGTALEDPIAKVWATERQALVYAIGVTVRREHSWARASIDRAVSRCRDSLRAHTRECFLEVKATGPRGWWDQDRWAGDLPPAAVLAQVAWQRWVVGADHAHVVVASGTEDRTWTLTGEQLDPIAEVAVPAAAYVWECVQAGVVPAVAAGAPDVDASLVAVPREDARVIVDVPDVERAAAAYTDALEDRRTADRAVSTHRRVLLEAMGTARYAATTGGWRWGVAESRSVDVERLAAEHPGVFADLCRRGLVSVSMSVSDVADDPTVLAVLERLGAITRTPRFVPPVRVTGEW